MMMLHGYWRSGTSYRLRIALNLKRLSYGQVTRDLRRDAHKTTAYLHLHPQGLVPALETDDGVLIQSPAILEWLDERFPDPPLLPDIPAKRAVVRAMAGIVSCDIHPLNNLRVLTSLREDLNADEGQVLAWISRWITCGFEALEQLIGRFGGNFAFGDAPGLADINLVPQVYSAERFKIDLSAFPHIRKVADHARTLPAFARAAPEMQPDADKMQGKSSDMRTDGAAPGPHFGTQTRSIVQETTHSVATDSQE